MKPNKKDVETRFLGNPVWIRRGKTSYHAFTFFMGKEIVGSAAQVHQLMLSMAIEAGVAARIRRPIGSDDPWGTVPCIVFGYATSFAGKNWLVFDGAEPPADPDAARRAFRMIPALTTTAVPVVLPARSKKNDEALKAVRRLKKNIDKKQAELAEAIGSLKPFSGKVPLIVEISGRSNYRI